MTPGPPTLSRALDVDEHHALTLLADRLTEAGFEAGVEPEPAFPVLFVTIPGTRALREMVLVSGRDYAWDASEAHCRVNDLAGAAVVLARHISDLGDRVAPPADQHWPPTPLDTDDAPERS